MCGGFVLFDDHLTIREHFGLDTAFEINPGYNICPGSMILGVGRLEEKLSSMLFRWGLIPGWSKSKQTQYKMINARMEGIWHKPSFKSAIRYRRCLIPASGFYEWKKTASGKQPYFITASDSSILAMAGIWESWEDKSSGEVILSCSILTTEAGGVVKDIHDRMPVIIDPSGYTDWLDCRVQSSKDLIIREKPAEKLTAWPVRTLVNNPGNNSLDLFRAVDSKR